MTKMKVGAVEYRSKSAYAKYLLQRSNMTDAEIARKVSIKPQTVLAIKKDLMLKGFDA